LHRINRLRRQYVYVLRAVHADRPFLGVAKDKFPKHLQPTNIFQQSDLDAKKIVTPWFDAVNGSVSPPLMVETGQLPVYLGQPVALLVFKDELIFREASRLMQFDPDFVQYGPPVDGPIAPALLGDPTTYYFIRNSKDG